MSQARMRVVAVVGIVGLTLFASMARADMAVTYLPPEDDGDRPSHVLLAADRVHGFAPMTVNLSGMVETTSGDLVPINGGQQIRLIVDSPVLRVQNSVTSSKILSEMHYEAVSPGPEKPSAFRRVIEIRRPGNYVFRIQVIAPDGNILSSNDVSVKAL